MVYSGFNVYIQDCPRQGYVLIYNTLSKQVMCIRKDAVASPSEHLRYKLQQHGMMVDDLASEIEAVENSFNNNMFNNDELRIMLILTRKCNCKCIYCYEDQQNAQFDDLQDVEDILRFIETTMYSRRLSKLKVIFYGGEPLLKKELITCISQQLYDKLSTRFRFTIISNGTLLDEKHIALWASLGLEAVKVTIDGNRNSHNQRRPYRDGGGTYQDIMDNLSIISRYVNIILNIVIDSSVHGIGELVDELFRRGVEPEFALSLREPCCCSPQEKAELVTKYVKLLHDKGAYQSTKIAVEHGTICMGKDQNYFVIDGKKQVYQCNANFNSRIGTIDSLEEKPYRKVLSQRCKKCTYLPICYGGCIYEKQCEADYFDIVIPQLVRIYTREI